MKHILLALIAGTACSDDPPRPENEGALPIRLDSATPDVAYPGDRVVLGGSGFATDDGNLLARISSAFVRCDNVTSDRAEFVVPEGLAPGATSVALVRSRADSEAIPFEIVYEPDRPIIDSVQPNPAMQMLAVEVTGRQFCQISTCTVRVRLGDLELVPDSVEWTVRLTFSVPGSSRIADGSYPLFVVQDGKRSNESALTVE